MTDKELIKQEIEKRKQEIWPKNTGEMCVVDTPKSLVQGWLNALDWVLNTIDSIPEEPVSEDLEEEVNNWRHNHFHGRRDKDTSGEYLERESQLDLARHFAEWQKNKDLEDSLKSDLTMPNKFYEKGRFDMREEMMKNAVDAFVNTYENTDDSNYVEFVTEQSPYKFKETEKCKIIIVKED